MMVGIFYAPFTTRLRQNAYLCRCKKTWKMNLRTIVSKILIVTALALAACQTEPKTDLERVDALIKQVQDDVTTLNELENKEHVQLKKDFMACDSMLQFLHPEEVDEIFQQLQLVGAYIGQFEETCPVMRANIDTTLTQLDNLRSDIETHYLSDSLTAIYLDMESQHVTRINNQVEYFRDRFADCKKDLNTFKKKR